MELSDTTDITAQTRAISSNARVSRNNSVSQDRLQNSGKVGTLEVILIS